MIKENCYDILKKKDFAIFNEISFNLTRITKSKYFLSAVKKPVN
jgi:hypothetical protein